ncbi:hypothetical protein FNV62_00400 [Streptomyces sp. RLB3-17]|uniref:hypothetical protein n=1 Tax=Streptomyces TaxID=1883 RepID=UPI001162F2E7|nr:MULTISPECIES: hypothetical protein [unclassified Streptomyces]QDN54376.1 hypothetical protein FNV67_02050 [Streptomyces sp. S1D4-20]QDN64558.1 hypothetical protein FNV66_01685 [Streptomyces sp. S1D4-14]QDN74879.1 hypothetical protein FNV64_03570 [Streptomyces sp. S1A1-7]QDN95072.1 hypothetical protein FNV58_01820 [Streptomyces sp. RLB1-9]QDO16796.1 hypothetical protein FNV65_00390 [Streptomyces sp. S1A1-8]
MRLRISIPLPGPFSIGGSIPLTSRRRNSGPGAFAALFKLLGYCLIAEAWLVWWCLKPFHMLGILAHRKATGRSTPIWRSRNGWW